MSVIAARSRDRSSIAVRTAAAGTDAPVVTVLLPPLMLPLIVPARTVLLFSVGVPEMSPATTTVPLMPGATVPSPLPGAWTAWLPEKLPPT